jgi:hypothetical protein
MVSPNYIIEHPFKIWHCYLILFHNNGNYHDFFMNNIDTVSLINPLVYTIAWKASKMPLAFKSIILMSKFHHVLILLDMIAFEKYKMQIIEAIMHVITARNSSIKIETQYLKYLTRGLKFIKISKPNNRSK